MRSRYSIAVVGLCIALASFVRPVVAQDCGGSSGSATINGSPWSTACVIALTAPGCIDSLGQQYECFQIVGVSADSSDAYAEVAIFLAGAPTQGQVYSLGGAHPNGALVLGQGGFWLTGDPPYTGSVSITTYNISTSTIACTFSFMARGLFGGDVTVTNGIFNGRLVGVAEKSWAAVKQLYRTPGH